ncbi:MAG: VanZ family protein [Acidobacteriota bacterium]
MFGLYTLVLYSTLSLAFDLYVDIYQKWGRSTVSTSMNLSFVLTGALLVFWISTAYRPSLGAWVTLALIGLVVALCLWALTVPAKRFHFFEYALLTLLVFDAVRFRVGGWHLFLQTIGLVGLIGFGDEMIQAALPDRHFGLLDLGINLTAGILTILFIVRVVGRRNYPWGRIRSGRMTPFPSSCDAASEFRRDPGDPGRAGEEGGVGDGT